MKKLIMKGEIIVNSTKDDETIILGSYLTTAELYLEDQKYMQIAFPIDFPSANFKENAEFYLCYKYRQDDPISCYNEHAVKISDKDLFIHVRFNFNKNRVHMRFSCYARLYGEIPRGILQRGSYNLSLPSVKRPKTVRNHSSVAQNIYMTGKIQLNYLNTSPFFISSSKGKCDLQMNPQDSFFLSFEYKIPELKIKEIEFIQINGKDFQGERFFSLWIHCIQLSQDELLIGFSIFEDREDYPHSIGGYARLRGKIPSGIQRTILV